AQLSPDPQPPLGVLGERRDLPDRQAVPLAEELDGVSLEPYEAPDGHGPERPVAGLEELGHRAARGIALRLPAGEPPGAAAQQPFGRSDPERAVAPLAEGANPVVADRGAVAGIEDREANAVESDEALLGAEPQVTVAGLEDRVHRVLREAGVAVPDVAAVLGERGAGVQAAGAGGAEPQDEACRQGPRPDAAPPAETAA